MMIKTVATLFAKKPRTVILVFTLFTILIGSQVINLYMVSDFSSYLPRDDPVLKLWNKINKEFEIGDTIIVLIHQDDSRDPNDIRDYDVLREMDGICRVLYDYPRSQGKDTGIASIKSLSVLMREENKKAPPLGHNLDDIPIDKKDIYSYMERPSISGMKGILYTNDFKYAVIIIQVKKDADYDTVLLKTKEAIKHRGTKFANMSITGTIPMQKAIQQNSMDNFKIIFPVSILFIAIVLLYFHRSFKGIIIAFLPPIYAIVLTFGTLGIVAPQLSMISIAIVALLMGLGVDYSIHLMNRFAEEKKIEDRINKIEKVLKSTGKAVLLSTVTTVIGFASLMISSMSPMVFFGFGCAIGILFAFISAMILVPCLVVALNFTKTGRIPLWKKFASFAVNNRKRMLFIAVFFACMSIVVLPQVKTDVNYFDMAPKNISEVNSMLEYSEKFGKGGNFNAFLIETDPHGLEDPQVINAIYNMSERMRVKGVTVTSIADPLKQINDVLSMNLIVEKLANLTDADKIFYDKIFKEGLINKDHSKTLGVVSIPIGKSMEELESLINEINSIADETVIPHNGKVSHLTGQNAINVAVNNKLKEEQTRSMILALILVLAALILVFNSSVYGFLTMIPVFFVLIWEPGFLVASNIPLSPVTITIASIMIGIGIDYGVHITHRFREEKKNGVSKTEATMIAIEKTGLSLLEAALTTVAGIASILIVNITALNQFVTVIIFMTSVSCVGAALILPVFYEFKFVK